MTFQMDQSNSTACEYTAASAGQRPSPLLEWESAYERFETPRQEIEKFTGRLRRMGSAQWPRNAEIVELFCGRGNGLHALNGLGFTRLEGVDLSPRLVARYSGSAKCYVGDCRNLPFADASKDVLIVQGGLHHLPELPADLDLTLAEVRRVLRPDGLFLAIEPWLTTFLSVVHAVTENRLARRVSNKLDALAIMIEHERETYEQWLHQPDLVLSVFARYFHAVRCEFHFGKLMFLGRPKTSS